MTVGEIKAYVASMVDDKQFAYFTETELLIYINQEMRETQKLILQAGSNWYVKIDQSQSTVVNQANYTLPTDFLIMNRIELVTNPGVNETRYSVQSIVLNQKDSIAWDNDVAGFYFLKNTLYFAPIPRTVRTIRMYYSYLIPEVALDADTPDVPPQYHEYIADRVACTCFLKDGRDPSFILRRTQIVEDALKQTAIERAQDHASRVVIVDEDSGIYG